MNQLAFDLSGGDPTSPLARPTFTAAAPPDAAARDRIADDTACTLFVEAGAGAGKTTALVGRILTLVDEGVAIEAIAAITFTEKAAAELRHRLRQQLAAEPVTPRRQDALDGLDHAPVGTLHAFARRLLLEFPVEAGLPPGFDVLDELESQLTLDERWEDVQDELLDDAHREIAPGLSAADFVILCDWGRFGGLGGLRGIVEDFQANWDLVAERVDLTAPPRPQVDMSSVLAEARAVGLAPVPPGDKQEDLVGRVAQLADRLAAAGSDIRQIVVLEALRETTAKPGRTGNKVNWRLHGGGEALDELRARQLALSHAAEAVLAPWREYRRLVVGQIAADFVLAGARARAAAGTLEFHDLLVVARRLLATSGSTRVLLHDRYQRVLLDEFQDTDPIQLEIAVRLTAPPTGQASDATALRPVPGRLFVVGDPKQSIYRFRRADIAVFLAAPARIGATEIDLSANFRSTAAVIDWVNGVFGTVIRAEPDVQPAYHPLDVARTGPRDHGTVHVLGADEHAETPDAKVSADELRWREAQEVAAAVATALRDRWLVGDGDELRPGRAGDIAILLPARTSLPMLERALAALAVPYRAENAAVVYLAPEIRHVMLTLRAAADPTDQLALVAALRSPLYGCSDVELYDWKSGGGRWSIFAPAPAALAEHPVATALAHIRALAERASRLGPAELVDAVVGERRVLEVALAGADTRDVWRRVRYVIDQARAWTDAGGRGLRRYLRWTRFQANEGRASDTILPERDHDAVRIMTVHAAKGLEFPITIVAGMTTQNKGRRRLSVVWPPGTWTLAERDDPIFETFKPLDEQMSDAERRRLLYVACTRAVDHLVVSLHRKHETEAAEHGRTQWTSAGVLAAEGGLGFGATTFAARPAALPRVGGEPIELPWADEAVWAEERRRALRVASLRTTTSATRLAAAMPVPGAGGDGDDLLAEPDVVVDQVGGADEDGDLLALTVDAGLAKDPVDLDLPPWQRGRYGTAVGRAVHAVLQDADLVTGGDLAALATTHAAAEGIFGLEPLVERLARSALAAPIVQQAAGGAEHWRELFVVAPIGDVVVEGYIDLLVRTPQGLVIVDYKTDQWTSESDRRARVARYRRQLATYGVALARLLDEAIVGGMLVRCVDGGPAESHAVEGWAAACEEVEAVTRTSAGAVGAADGAGLA